MKRIWRRLPGRWQASTKLRGPRLDQHSQEKSPGFDGPGLDFLVLQGLESKLQAELQNALVVRQVRAVETFLAQGVGSRTVVASSRTAVLSHVALLLEKEHHEQLHPHDD